MADSGIHCRIRVRKGEREVEVAGMDHPSTVKLFDEIVKKHVPDLADPEA